MRDEPERDNATLTIGRVCRRPGNISKVVFFYVLLTLFKVCLVAMIRVNSVTIMHFGFHCRAIELLHMVQGVLSMRGAR
jgi:NADH:ubiquinone oxidoreductase subunit B-like Fe-S oxidoreductase